MSNELGDLLRKLRGKLSLRDAAEKSGISHNYLSIVEKGKDPRSGSPIKPTPDTLRMLATAYNYPYEELLKIAGVIDDEVDYAKSKNEFILKEIVSKYDIDLTAPGKREKLEQLIKLVLDDSLDPK